MAEGDLIQTGIAGLDKIFLGGVLQGNVILVEGAPGTGKTLLGLTFIHRGITEYHQPGIIVVFETAPGKLIRDAAGFGWNFEELQAQNKLQIIFTSPQVLEKELRSPDSLLMEAAAKIGARRIFIDGVSLLRPVPNGNGSGDGSGLAPFRDLLQQVVEGLQRENLTAMLSHEITAGAEQTRTLDVAEFISDTVIHLARERIPSGGIHRSIEIVKSRGQGFDEGKHTLQIGEDGLHVFRRVQAQAREFAQPTSTTKRSIIGAEPLDTLIGGGIFEGSTTMVVGVSGAGKTVLGVQLLLEGAAKHGHNGLLVSLDEHPEQIIRNAETLGLNLREQIDAGKIQVLFDSPQELEVDAHFHRITQTIEKRKVERLLIDGMTSYSNALRSKQVYRDFLLALVAYAKNRLITVFFNYENPELFGLTHYMPDYGVSSIVDNIILMNFVELGDTLHRAITVAKARGCHHSFVTREFVVKQGGIHLLPEEGSKLAALPFGNYYGLLSRAPTRYSPPLQGAGSAPGEERPPRR